MSLVIVGSVALDSIETPRGKVLDALGGSAVYASLAASYFSPTQIVGVVGEDYPASARDLLTRHHVGLDGLETMPGKTFRWSGRYREWNEAETISTELNVFAELSPQLPPSCRCCRSLLLANIHPRLQLQVRNQIQSDQWVACDTMNYWISLCPAELAKVIQRVDILFINEQELRLYTGMQNIFAAARSVLAEGPKAVVVKRGEYGSVTVLHDDLFFAPAYPVEEVQDPTGAGDCFAGAFMGYLATQEFLDRDTIRAAVRRGTVLAALDVASFSVEGIIKVPSETIDIRVEQLRRWS